MKTTFWALLMSLALLPGVATAAPWNRSVSVDVGAVPTVVDMNANTYEINYRGRGPYGRVWVYPPVVQYRSYYNYPQYGWYGNSPYRSRYWTYRW